MMQKGFRAHAHVFVKGRALTLYAVAFAPALHVLCAAFTHVAVPNVCVACGDPLLPPLPLCV